MRRVNSLLALSGLILPPVAGFAQQNESTVGHDTAEASAAAEHVTAVADRGARLELGDYAGARLSFDQEAKSAPQRPKPGGTKPHEINRPPIEGSMVGYIDNAIIGS